MAGRSASSECGRSSRRPSSQFSSRERDIRPWRPTHAGHHGLPRALGSTLGLLRRGVRAPQRFRLAKIEGAREELAQPIAGGLGSPGAIPRSFCMPNTLLRRRCSQRHLRSPSRCPPQLEGRSSPWHPSAARFTVWISRKHDHRRSRWRYHRRSPGWLHRYREADDVRTCRLRRREFP